MSNQFQITRKTRDAMILALRRAFLNDDKYPYIETATGEYNFDLTKIIISDAIPQEHAFFPAVIVDSVSGNEQRYLGPDDLGEVKDSNHLIQEDNLFASINLTLNIRVYTIDDTIARDEIIDRIYDRLKLITDDLANAGVEIKHSNFLSESRRYERGRWYVTAGMSIEVYTEWSDTLDIGDRVEKIPINITVDLEP